MLNDKEITGRIASWDSNGNAVYVGKLNNENFCDQSRNRTSEDEKDGTAT